MPALLCGKTCKPHIAKQTKAIYSNIENHVLWAWSESIGFAVWTCPVLFCSHKMCYNSLQNEPIRKVATFYLIPHRLHYYTARQRILDQMVIVLLSPWVRNDSQLCPTSQRITEYHRKQWLTKINPFYGRRSPLLGVNSMPPSEGGSFTDIMLDQVFEENKIEFREG